MDSGEAASNIPMKQQGSITTTTSTTTTTVKNHHSSLNPSSERKNMVADKVSEVNHRAIAPATTCQVTAVTPTAAVLGQPQMTSAVSAATQYFIAGPTVAAPNAPPNFPMQQILIPVTHPAQLGAAAAAGCLGPANAQQYITIPVSLSTPSAQQLQLLANAPMFTAANFTGLAGLQHFPMMPAAGHLSQMSEDHLKMGHAMSAVPNAPVIISSPNFFPSTVTTSSADEIATALKNHITSVVSGNLPSIQTLSQQKSDKVPATSTVPASSAATSVNSEILVSNAEPGATVDGVDLDDIKEFARQFKLRRLSMGLTQTQVGQALSVAEGPAYSQSAICRFEKLDITPKSAQKIKPVLEQWLRETELRFKHGKTAVNDISGSDPPKKRKRRTSFTPQAVELLCEYFKTNTHPSGSEMSDLADRLAYDREVVRVWFCNKRQSLKNAAKRLKSSSETTTVKPS